MKGQLRDLFLARPRILVLALMLGGVLAVVAAAWWFGSRGGISINRIVLISIDTCRADRLGCYGYGLPTTPRIDAISREGIRFDNVTAPVPMTLPSHCTMLTGTNPPAHGVHDNFAFHLGQSHVTLAEILQERGFATAAFVSTFVLDRRFGLDQGFDTYDDEVESEGGHGNERGAADTTDAALAWLDRHVDDPLFLLIHYYDPHEVYEPPEPFRSRFDHPYDGEIAFVDHAIGRVVDRLKALGLDDSTLLIVTADHGEMHGEHGEEGHSYSIYQEAVRVPLIFRLPKGAGRESVVESGPVGIIDVLPTVCGLLGIDPPSDLHGVDLSEILRGAAEPDPQRYVYCESFTPLRYGANSLLGLVGRRWKLVQTTRPELYDLSADPRELRNLASVQPDRLEQLQENLQDVLRTQRREGDGSRMQLSAEAAGRIRSIGYASGGDMNADDGYGHDDHRPDPKDLLDLHRRYGIVNGMVEAGRYEEARTESLAMLEKYPDFAPALINLGRIDMDLDDFAAAKVHLERALQIEPHDADGQNRLGTCLRKLDRPREAIAFFEQALTISPPFAEAHRNLGLTLMALGDVERAINHYRQALAINPRYADAHLGLGIALASHGKLVDAIGHLEKAVRLRPDVAEARHRLAGALEAAGRTAEAAVQFEALAHQFEALAHSRPDDADAHFNLAMAMVASKHSAEALPALSEAIRLRPGWPEALNARAWILATHADPKVRAPSEALRLARRAAELTRRKDPAKLDTLAAAHAAGGDFGEAVKVAREGLALPGAAKGGLAGEIRSHLRWYEAGKPYVDR